MYLGFDSDAFRFSLAMLILSLFTKVYSFYYATQYFAAIGGAQSMDASTGNAYSSLNNSGHVGGGYYPPQESQILSESQSKQIGLAESGGY